MATMVDTTEQQELERLNPYPGHPFVIAVSAVLAFGSIEAAIHKPEGVEYPAMLSSRKIGGAGGMVWAACNILRRIHKGDGERAMIRALGEAAHTWACADGDSPRASSRIAVQRAIHIWARCDVPLP